MLPELADPTVHFHSVETESLIPMNNVISSTTHFASTTALGDVVTDRLNLESSAITDTQQSTPPESTMETVTPDLMLVV